MTESGLKKAGWTWTKKGWKKIPRRLARVKLAPPPRKNRLKKIRRVSPTATKRAKPIPAEAPQTAKEQGRADSAPTPGPEAAKPAQPQRRRTWGGKYDDLAKPSKREPL
jgi:hypothetical protein